MAEPWNERRVKNVSLGVTGDDESRCNWARQSSGALPIRIPKSGDIGYGQTDYHQPGCSDCPA